MHQAGVPGLPPDLATEQLCDWDHMCARLVTLLRTTLTEPLAVTDELHFAVPALLLDRVARQVAPSGPPAPDPAPGSPLGRAMPPGAAPDAAFANRRDVPTAQIPSFGTMSAERRPAFTPRSSDTWAGRVSSRPRISRPSGWSG